MFPAHRGRAALRRWLACLCILCLLDIHPAYAQVLGDLETDVDRGIPLVRIRFTGAIQIIRYAPPERGQVVEIFFRLVGSQDVVPQPAAQETRSSRARDGIPGLTVVYPAQPNSAVRRLEVQFDRPVSYSVRTSEDSRSIDLYLTPEPKAAAPATPPAAPPSRPSAAPPAGPSGAPPAPPAPPPGQSPPPPGAAAVPVPGAVPVQSASGTPVGTVEYPPGSPFAINLQTVAAADISALRPVPVELAGFDAFVLPSVRDGKPEVELNLGWFKTAA